MDVYPVEEGPAYLLLVARYGGVGAGAFLYRVAVVAARARVHCGDEHEVRREREGATGASNCDDPVLQRLTQRFEGLAAEFGQFIEEEHTSVGQRYLPGPRNAAPTYQAGVRDSVVRGTEGP